MIDPVGSATSGVLVNLRAWLSGSPWRLAAGWAMLVGLVATAGPQAIDLSLTAVLLALLLADAVWGALWSQIAERSVWPGLENGNGLSRLPYASADGIAGHPGWLSHTLRDVLPLAALAVLIALVVGQGALVLTAAVMALAFAGWALRRHHHAGAARWLQAFALIAAPFALGVWLASRTPGWPGTGWLLALGIGLTVLFRSSLAAAAPETAGAVPLAGAGSIFVLAALLWAGRPIAAGLAAAAAAAPLLILSQHEQGKDPRLGVAHGWWWFLALGAAAALGLGIG